VSSQLDLNPRAEVATLKRSSSHQDESTGEMKLSKCTPARAIAALILCLSLVAFWLRKSSLIVPPAPSETPVPISIQAAESLEETLGRFSSLPPGNSFEIHVTEEEITSYLAMEYPEALFRDAQVRIEDNRVRINALITDPIRARTQILCSIRAVDERVKTEFQQITLGRLNLPSFLLKSLAIRLNEMIDTAPLAISITDVQLQEGKAIISGRRKTGEP